MCITLEKVGLKEVRSRERLEGALLLVLMVEEGAMSQGMLLQKLEKTRKWVLPWSLQREHRHADTLTLAR